MIVNVNQDGGTVRKCGNVGSFKGGSKGTSHPDDAGGSLGPSKQSTEKTSVLRKTRMLGDVLSPPSSPSMTKACANSDSRLKAQTTGHGAHSADFQTSTETSQASMEEIGQHGDSMKTMKAMKKAMEDLETEKSTESKRAIKLLVKKVTENSDKAAQIMQFMGSETELGDENRAEIVATIKDSRGVRAAVTNAIQVLEDFYKESGMIAKEPWEFAQLRGHRAVGLPDSPDTPHSSYTGVADPKSGSDGVLSILDGVVQKFMEFVQVRSHRDVELPDSPDAWDSSYTGVADPKSGSDVVLSILDGVMQKFGAMEADAKVQDETVQKNYEGGMQAKKTELVGTTRDRDEDDGDHEGHGPCKGMGGVNGGVVAMIQVIQSDQQQALREQKQ